MRPLLYPVAQFVVRHSAFTDLALVIVTLARSRVRFKFRFCLAPAYEADKVYVDDPELVINVCEDLVRF